MGSKCLAACVWTESNRIQPSGITHHALSSPFESTSFEFYGVGGGAWKIGKVKACQKLLTFRGTSIVTYVPRPIVHPSIHLFRPRKNDVRGALLVSLRLHHVL